MVSRKKATYGREIREETHQAMILSFLDFVKNVVSLGTFFAHVSTPTTTTTTITAVKLLLGTLSRVCGQKVHCLQS